MSDHGTWSQDDFFNFEYATPVDNLSKPCYTTDSPLTQSDAGQSFLLEVLGAVDLISRRGKINGKFDSEENNNIIRNDRDSCKLVLTNGTPNMTKADDLQVLSTGKTVSSVTQQSYESKNCENVMPVNDSCLSSDVKVTLFSNNKNVGYLTPKSHESQLRKYDFDDSENVTEGIIAAKSTMSTSNTVNTYIQDIETSSENVNSAHIDNSTLSPYPIHEQIKSMKITEKQKPISFDEPDYAIIPDNDLTEEAEVTEDEQIPNIAETAMEELIGCLRSIQGKRD